jgi:hypothetical protein
MKSLLFSFNLLLVIALTSHISAQNVTCELFSITGLEPDTFNVNNTMVNIAMAGESSLFASFPYIASVTDCDGDTIASGDLYYFGQIGGTVQGYPVTSIPENVCFPITIEFVYGNDIFETDTCLYSYGSTGITYTGKPSMRLNAYPTPSTDEIQLASNTDIMGESYVIFNSTGKTMKTGIIDAQNARIDLRNLPSGFYVITVGETTTRFIKE